MGENKGHGIKGPRHDNDVDDLSINTASGKIASGGQQQSGNMHPGAQDSVQSGNLGSLQSDQGSGSLQAGQKQQGNQRSKQQGKQQSGQQQGSMQSGQGGQQQGGQHASGGTPALDDLGSRQGESAEEASQAWSQNSGKQGRGKR